jgi:YHS domain-containing protein
MMTTAFVLTLLISKPADLVCPMMASPASEKVASVDYNGVHFAFCCGGCPEAFAKDPAKALANPKLKGKTVGEFLFDPVARKRIKATEAKATTDYQGIRYNFFSTANLAAFKKSPGTYSAMPKQEVLHCPVANEKLHGYQLAYMYKDVAGVRYYICCEGCAPKFEANPTKYTVGVKSKIQSPSAWKWEPGQATPSECKD